MERNTGWKARLKNKSFWLSLSAAMLLLVQAVAAIFGYQWDFTILGQQLTALINAVFAVLAVLGVVADPAVDWIQENSEDGK